MLNEHPCQALGPAVSRYADEIVELLTTAYHTCALAEWTIADPLTRRDVARRHFRVAVDHAINKRAATMILDGQGVAAVSVGYLPGQLGGPGEIADYVQRLIAATDPWTTPVARLYRELDAQRPAQPAYHQAYLAVRADRHGQRLAHTLLAHAHRRLDELDVPAHTEVVERHLLNLYQRHGYTLRDSVELPDSGPSLHALWRAPMPHLGPGAHHGAP